MDYTNNYTSDERLIKETYEGSIKYIVGGKATISNSHFSIDIDLDCIIDKNGTPLSHIS